MIVLTGGAGFIGSCFLKKLNDMKIYDIIVVDHLGAGDKWKNLIGKRFSQFIDKTTFRQYIRDKDYGATLDAIIHLGACSVTTERDADYMLDNNYIYSIELAEYANDFEAKFIYASSGATYGMGENGYSDYEFDNLKPMNVYGFSKHLFDLWVLENGLENKFTGLKFFNVFGPNEYHKGDMASVVYKAYNQLKDTGKIKLFKSNHPDYGDGGQKRDFIYVKDVVELMWRIYEAEEFSGIYNIGAGKAKSWNDLANAVFKAAGKKPDIEYFDMPDHLKGQYQNFTEAEMDKLKYSLGSLKFTPLEEAVGDYVQNYLMKDWKYI